MKNTIKCNSVINYNDEKSMINKIRIIINNVKK